MKSKRVDVFGRSSLARGLQSTKQRYMLAGLGILYGARRKTPATLRSAFIVCRDGYMSMPLVRHS